MIDVAPDYERYDGAASRPLPASYRRHEPETTVLYQTVQQHLDTLLQQARDRSDEGYGLPRFVEEKFRHYLDCAQLCRGFSRVRCAACGYEDLLAFSCKIRGVRTSCIARRMQDGAEHLIEHVLPQAA